MTEQTSGYLVDNTTCISRNDCKYGQLDLGSKLNEINFIGDLKFDTFLQGSQLKCVIDNILLLAKNNLHICLAAEKEIDALNINTIIFILFIQPPHGGEDFHTAIYCMYTVLAAPHSKTIWTM